MPCSDDPPSSSTMMRSQCSIVDSRCAITIVVRPRISCFERRLDQALGLGVERRGRLVEDQDRRILEDRARDRDPLPLAARQTDAALADDRGEAVAAASG